MSFLLVSSKRWEASAMVMCVRSLLLLRPPLQGHGAAVGGLAAWEAGSCAAETAYLLRLPLETLWGSSSRVRGAMSASSATTGGPTFVHCYRKRWPGSCRRSTL